LKTDLAYWYTKQGKFALAKPLYLECIEWRTKKFGKDDPRTVLFRHNLAGLYRDSGEYDEAEKLDKECYESRLRTLGAENPSTLSSMSALADTYVCLKYYGLAETQAKECLQIRRRIIGPKHPAVFLTQHILARAYLHQPEKLSLAEAELIECIQGLKIIPEAGKDHAETLYTQSTLSITRSNGRGRTTHQNHL
jgi:tetratricopeptide (TPR) repeat protein